MSAIPARDYDPVATEHRPAPIPHPLFADHFDRPGAEQRLSLEPVVVGNPADPSYAAALGK